MSTKNTRSVLLQSALMLFAEKGYNGVSISEIVEKAQVTKPTLYYFFTNKEGIFKAVLEDNYGLLHEKLEKAACYIPNPADYSKDVYPVLVSVAETYFSFACENSIFYRMMLAVQYAPPDAQVSALSASYHALQYSILQECFRSMSNFHGNMKGREEQFSLSFIALVNVYISLWYSEKSDLSMEVAKVLVKQFMHGIFS